MYVYMYLYVYIHHIEPDQVTSWTASAACTTSGMPGGRPIGDESDPAVAAPGFTASTASARPSGDEDATADTAPGLTASTANAWPPTR